MGFIYLIFIKLNGIYIFIIVWKIFNIKIYKKLILKLRINLEKKNSFRVLKINDIMVFLWEILMY